MNILQDKVIFITGATKGFGKEFALKAAEMGAKIALVSKVVHQNASNTDTIFTMVDKIKALGSDALALQTDIRYDDQVQRAVDQTVDHFGQIDICVNAATVNPNNDNSQFDMVAYDLFHQINVRSAILIATQAKKALQDSENPHVLCLAPQYSDVVEKGANHFAYGFSRSCLTNMVTLLAKSLALEGIAVNGIWPKSPVDQYEREFFAFNKPNEEPFSIKLLADAAIKLVQQPSKNFTGNISLDMDIIADTGVTSFDDYYPDQMHIED